ARAGKVIEEQTETEMDNASEDSGVRCGKVPVAMTKFNDWKRWTAALVSLTFALGNCDDAMSYAFNMVVPDIRQPSSVSGGSACPVRAHQLAAAGNISLRWSTALGSSPTTIFTNSLDANGRLAELEQTIATSLGVWTGVSGTTLTPASFSPLIRVSNTSA